MNYFIEGLQGSGKSTLLSKISDLHPDYRVLREGDYNPVELSWCAYMTDQQYFDILEKYPDISSRIKDLTFSEGDRRIVCYTKVQTDNGEFYKDLEQFEIYNGRVSQDDFKKIILRRFENWHGNDSIFECSLFQNIVVDMLLFRNATDVEIIDFYKDIRNALEGKDMKILYLRADNIKANLDVIRKERSDENGNELWFPMMCGFFNDSLYARENGVSGEEGLIDHFAQRQELELRICRELFADKVTVLSSKGYTDKMLADL